MTNKYNTQQFTITQEQQIPGSPIYDPNTGALIGMNPSTTIPSQTIISDVAFDLALVSLVIQYVDQVSGTIPGNKCIVFLTGTLAPINCAEPYATIEALV